MKKIVLLSFILFCETLFAQKITFTYSENTVKCEIEKDTTNIVSENDLLDYYGEISSVGIVETPPLKNRAKHIIKVNGLEIASINCKEKTQEQKKLENPITLRSGEIISCFRDNDLVGRINIKEKGLTIEELLDNIKFEIISPKDNPFTFKKDKEQLFKFRISGLDKVDTTNCLVKCGDDLPIPYTINGDELSFTIEPNILDANKAYAVQMEFDVVVNEKVVKKEYPLVSVTSPFKHGLSLLEIIVIGLLLLLVVTAFICIVVYVTKILYFRRAQTIPVIMQNRTRVNLKVHCDGSLHIGNVSNKSGEFHTESGYVYRFDKRKFRYPKLTFVGYAINCKEGKCFILDFNNNKSNTPSFVVKLSDTIITINKDASVEGEGWYDLKDGYSCFIEGGKISRIAKLLVDKNSNKPFRLLLTNNTPQKNDKIEPITNKRNYSIETSDGFIYEICNNRVVNIREVQHPNIIEILCANGQKITVVTNEKEPKEGDTAVPNGEFVCTEGKTYIVKGGIIKTIIEKKEKSIEDIRLELARAQEKILELEKRPTQKEYAQLEQQLQNALQKIKDDEVKMADVDKAIESAAKSAREEEKRKVESQYRAKISAEYISIASYKSEKNNLEKLKEEALKAKKKAEEKVKIKEGEVAAAMEKIETLNAEKQSLSESIIRLKASVAKMKDAAQKKNVHYLIQVQEALSDISESFKDVYKDVEDSTIKDGLIAPLVKGVSGLSAGILSWSEDFSVKVLGDLEAFFGGDYLILPENEVKEQLAKKFISNIVKSDSFSKFVRLYQLSTVPFIRKQLVDARMEVNTLNKLYFKVITLITDFGYTIICPRLFEELHSDEKYQWYNSTNLFTFITLPESEKRRIKENGSETIIDVNQIGYKSPWASRKATAVTPDF